MRVVLLALLALSSCSLVFGALSPSLCEVGEAARCEGNFLLFCQDGFLVEIDCGAATCDPVRGSCVLCGDGVLDEGEACDDGNDADGDGCDSVCAIEEGFECGGEPSACQPLAVCGDGITSGAEECDDGNVQSGDGCSEFCVVEFCGDGIINGTEECDDGNNQNGDGCDENCVVELCGSGVAADARVFDVASGHCYLQFDTPRDWLVAQDDCQALGGHLVTISSSEENQLVRAMTSRTFWIGLNDREAEGDFRWVTGEPVIFTDFLPGEPNNSSLSGEDCVSFRASPDGWNDESCSSQIFPYVCEIEL